MKSHFLKKYKNRSSAELKSIVENPDQYRAEAREAAKELLGDNNSVINNLESVPDTQEKQPIIEINNEVSWFDSAFNLNFFNNIKPIDLLAPIILGVIKTIIDLSLIWILDFWAILSTITYLALLILIHHLYLQKHGRSNNFTGRLTSQVLFYVSMILSSNGLSLLVNNGPSQQYSFEGNPILLVLTGIIAIAIFDVIISGINWASTKTIKKQLF